MKLILHILLYLAFISQPAIAIKDLPKQCNAFYEKCICEEDEREVFTDDQSCKRCKKDPDGHVCKKLEGKDRIGCKYCKKDCKRCCVKKCTVCKGCKNRTQCNKCKECKKECKQCCRSICSDCKKKKRKTYHY